MNVYVCDKNNPIVKKDSPATAQDVGITLGGGGWGGGTWTKTVEIIVMIVLVSM